MAATFIISNSSVRGTLGGQSPILNGRTTFAAEVTPGASWSEVVIPGALSPTGDCLDVTPDAPVRIFVGAAAPDAGTVAWFVPVAQTRTLGVFNGDRVFVRTA